MADLKTTNIYGDAYINNKVGIATNAPATRLQIGQLSPTAATEGIQFGDDTSTRIYRSGTGAITVAGSLTYPSATVSGYITFPNDTNAAGLINTAGTAWLKLDDAYGNMYIVNNQSGAGIYFDSNAYYWRNSNGATTLLSLSGNGDLGAARYLSGTYVNTSDDVSTGNISHIVAKFGDNYHRSATAAKVAAFISGQTMNIGGNAATVTTNANLSGDVTSVGNTTTIANTVVTNAKLKEMGASTIKGNNSGTATTPSDLTPAQVATMLNNQTMNINGSSTSCTGNAVTATTATALTSMNISQFTNNSGYLTSAVTSLAGTTNRITVSGATGAVTLNLPQDIHTGASPTFAGLSLTSVSTTGATITNLTGAYQNTTVYDSPRTQSATPSRGIRAPASSIQFTDSYAIAPFYTYRSTGDWPVPYGIGWGTGGESSGIFQRYASNGSSFGDMIFYTGNDGSGAFSFRRHTWEGTTYFAAGSGELNTELFRIDWAGKATATSFALSGGFTITHPGSGYAEFSNWVLLGTTGFYSSTNSAHLHPNTGTYGSWKITGTRGGWGGIEFESGVSLMVNSNQVGFHRNGYGWQLWWSAGTAYCHKGDPGGGTQATIYDTTNGNGVLLRAAGTPSGYGDWNTFGNATQTTNAITQEYFNVGIGSSTPNSNFPSVVSYRYGILTNLGSGADARAQIYISHAGDDLIFRGGWGTASWQTWNRCLTNINSPYAYNMNQYVRTTDSPTFVDLFISGLQVRTASPTITLRDTDHRTGFIHVNSNIFYILTGGTDVGSGNWATVANGRWPMELNLSNNNATFGADVNAISFTGAGTGLTGTASSLTAGAVTNGFYTTGGQTIAGITYFSNGESINAYGIRGRFTNEYLHLYNKVGVGHPSGWGQGETSTPTQGLSTYGGLNIAYGDNGLSTFNGVIRANSNIRQGADLARPLANWSVAGASTGMVIFSFPGNTGNYGMVHCVFDIYEYNSNTVSTVIVGGHNWNGAWYNFGANVIGRCGKSVRLGAKDSKFCVVFGGAASSWEYGTIILRKIHNGGFYTGIMDMGGSFTTQQTTTESFSNISGDLRLLRTSADFIADGGVTGTSFSGAGTGLTGTASSLSIGGTAATATNVAWSGITSKPTTLSGFGITDAASINGASNQNFSANAIYPYEWIRFMSDSGIYWQSGTYAGWHIHPQALWGMSFRSNAATDCGLQLRRSDATSLGAVYADGTSIGFLTAAFGWGASFTVAGTMNRGTVPLGRIETITAYTILGNNNASAAAVPSALTPAQVATMLSGQTMNINGSSTSCTGNAATVTNGIYTTSYWTGTPLGKRRNRIHSADSTSLNSSITNLECGFTYGGSGEPTGPFIAFGGLGGSIDYSCQLVGAYSGGGNDFKIRTRNDDSSVWNTWRTIVTDGNYSSYSPGLTGANASGTWSINITGNAGTATSATSATSATFLNSSNYINRCGSSGNANTDFQNTPAGSVRHNGDDANLTNSPGGTWWFYDNYRHSNASNYWGIQVAWGWEDNANKLATRNITGNSFGGWVYYLNSNNYTDYTVTKTGTGASGTWAINITGNAATATTATNVTIANGSVTLAKIENITAYTILGNSNASAAATPAALSVATVATMLSGQTMNINGSSTSCSGNAATATLATKASTLSQGGGNGTGMTFNWSGQGGQPTWLWGSNDGTNIYVWNPSNFNVNYATSAGSATSATTAGSCSGNAASATNATTAGGLAVQSGTNYDANKIVRTDGNGYILAGWINTISGDNGTTAIDRVYASSDGYIRYYTPANFRTVLDVPTRNGSGVTNFGINTAPSNRLHINGDNANPSIRVDNGAVVLAASAASNSKTFYGWLPISIAGTTKWIQMYN